MSIIEYLLNREISNAMEKIFTRYEEKLNITQGIYTKNFAKDIKLEELKDLIKVFSNEKGRKPKMLVAKLGQDGHDRGAKVIASAFSDLGFEVDITKLFLTPEELFKLVNDNNSVDTYLNLKHKSIKKIKNKGVFLPSVAKEKELDIMSLLKLAQTRMNVTLKNEDYSTYLSPCYEFSNTVIPGYN